MNPEAPTAATVLALFIPTFLGIWLGVTALLAHLSGWRSLATRFAAHGPAVGDRLHLVSARMGTSWLFPVNYSRCLTLTLGQTSFGLSLLFPFRVLSPPLEIPWSVIAALEERPILLWRRTIVELHDSRVRLSFYSKAATELAAAYRRHQGGGLAYPAFPK
jgi:hypothetical protein